MALKEIPQPPGEKANWGPALAKAKAARESTPSSGDSGRVELHDFNPRPQREENIIPTDGQHKP